MIKKNRQYTFRQNRYSALKQWKHGNSWHIGLPKNKWGCWFVSKPIVCRFYLFFVLLLIWRIEYNIYNKTIIVCKYLLLFLNFFLVYYQMDAQSLKNDTLYRSIHTHTPDVDIFFSDASFSFILITLLDAILQFYLVIIRRRVIMK